MKKNIAVFASGTGSNFININNKINKNKINARICLLVSNNSNCGAVKFAKNNEIDVFIYNSNKFPGDDLEQNALINRAWGNVII